MMYIKRFFLMQELTINLRQVKRKIREVGGANRSRLLSPARMVWECAFLYNLLNHIRGRKSLKMECGP